jgi:hypothetical protein
LNFFSLFKRNLIFKVKKKIDIDSYRFSSKTSLDELFKFFKTDKSSEHHNFVRYYNYHLKKFKNKKINFLEIGSATGASASSFVKFFNKSQAFCADVNLTLVKFISPKINYFGIDCSNPKSLKKFQSQVENKYQVKKYDFIIDDGSHILSDQLKSLNFFYNFLKKNGLYIIEDYKFANYFARCKDINHFTIEDLINKVRFNRKIKSNLLSVDLINQIKKSKIYNYKGKTKISDIVFIKKIT